MNGPAGADIKWKGIAARPFKVVVLVELAAQAHKEDAHKAMPLECRLQSGRQLCGFASAPLILLPGHDTRRFPAVSSQTSGLMCLRSGSVRVQVRQGGVRWPEHLRRAH
jgi:hypothetical protein